MTLLHPVAAVVAVVLSCGLLLRWRQRSNFYLIFAGTLMLAIAAGSPEIAMHPARLLTVMVDLSPSTRGAAFRDRTALVHRIAELAGSSPARIVCFSDRVTQLPGDANLPDFPCEQTRYDSPEADAILLFSDGRFALPDSGAPTYPVIDPLLIEPNDAAITDLRLERNGAVAKVSNRGDARSLAWSGTTSANPVDIDAHSFSSIPSKAVSGSLIGAQLDAGDRWPENDALAIAIPPPARMTHWWIGDGASPAGWTDFAPARLPTNPSDYLGVDLIALSNVSADSLTNSQQQLLNQYVRDLGGSMLIFGGDRAFGAGGYAGSLLDTLSPLASNPPSATMHWMLLADSSGSMAASVNGKSRWDSASEAMLRLLPLLPAKDVVSVGSFARDLSWWSDSQPAEMVAAKITAPPPTIVPNGPTNLEPILQQLCKRTDSLPCDLLLLTDADTTIGDPQALAAALRSAHVRVSLLGLGNISSTNPVVQIVTATGGHWNAIDDPTRWLSSLVQLMRSAAPSRLETSRIQLNFDPSLNVAPRAIDAWNRVWIKQEATSLAADDEQRPLASKWRIGLGNVAAFAFTPSTVEVSAFAKTFADAPRDPRMKIEWECASKITVSVDTASAAGYLNGLVFALKLGDQPSLPLRQTGPGKYEIEVDSPRVPLLATLQLDGRVIDRRAIAGRYAAEFDAIGNDDAALAALATRTGGHVIGPAQHTPIAFPWSPRMIPVSSYFAAAGGVFIAIGVIRLRSLA